MLALAKQLMEFYLKGEESLCVISDMMIIMRLESCLNLAIYQLLSLIQAGIMDIGEEKQESCIIEMKFAIAKEGEEKVPMGV